MSGISWGYFCIYFWGEDGWPFELFSFVLSGTVGVWIIAPQLAMA
jgi:hypothetical protein